MCTVGGDISEQASTASIYSKHACWLLLSSARRVHSFPCYNLRVGRERRHPELERLICAAVSNERFATQLIAAPAEAIERLGYGKALSPSERDLVVSITDAADIYDFAARLHAQVHAGSDVTERYVGHD